MSRPPATTPSARAALAALWALAGAEPAALERARLDGDDPVLPGPFRVGTAALASVGAAALAATEAWRLRTGRAQSVALDVRAAAAVFRSERYLRVAGSPVPNPWGPLSGLYRTGDGRVIQLHCNFAHHEAGVLRALGCARSREAVQAAVASRSGAALEDLLATAGLPVGLVRTRDEWQAHPQAAAVAGLPLLEITRIGDALAEPCGTGRRPLAGVRVLDLTRVIAGPVAGRTLASHGADVLRVDAPDLPEIPLLVMDTGWGKRSTWIDLGQRGGIERLRALVRGADVFCQAYRPGALAARGFGADTLAALRPGIVCVTISAYGHTGPWRDRRGFDSLVQSVSGIAHEGGVVAGSDGPRHLPAQALDHATGHLAAFGAMVALMRRAREGGSYLVRLSLAQTGRWLDGLGRAPATARDPSREDIADVLEEADTPFGRLSHVGPAVRLSETPPFWARPPVPRGTDAPAWLAREAP